MNYTTTWTLNISDKISAPLNVINEKGKKTAEVVGYSFQNVSEKIEKVTNKARKFGDCLEQVRAIDWMVVSNGKYDEWGAALLQFLGSVGLGDKRF